jgi:hypothetical protein
MSTGTIDGTWKISIAESGSCLQSSNPPSVFKIDLNENNMSVVNNVNWGSDNFELEDYQDSLRPHLVKQTASPVVNCNGEESRALFGLIGITPDQIEVVVEPLAEGAQGGGSARGGR